MIPKHKPLRDKKWIRHVHDLPCVLSGFEGESDPAHIRYRFFGTGMKPDDDLVLPVRHELHRLQHTMGEVRFWRANLITNFNPETDHLIMEALKAYARQMYREWKDE